MFKKIVLGLLIAVIIAVPVSGVVLADEHYPGDGGGRPGRGRRGGKRGAAGTVTTVNTAANSFSIEILEGELVTFFVDENTIFKSEDGSLESFADLEPSMFVGVRARFQGDSEGDNTLTAAGVAVIDPASLTWEKTGGSIVSIGSSNFTIENRDGEQLTFQVDADTLYKSRDGELESFADLEEEMKVGVRYETQDDGTLLAKTIGSGKPKRGGRGPGGPGGQDAPTQDA